MKSMKEKLGPWVLLLLLVAAGKPSNAQPCQKVEIATDPDKQAILRDFISDSEKTHYFIHDKGIVELRVYTDKKGRDCWLLVPRIDDSYKDNPPKQYAAFDYDIILIYQANASGVAHPTKGDTATLNQCLEDVIGDRVYIRPKKGRWTDSIGLDSKAKRLQTRRITSGSSGEIQVIFNKDGTYKILKPV
jgi:hypothetical protein